MHHYKVVSSPNIDPCFFASLPLSPRELSRQFFSKSWLTCSMNRLLLSIFIVFCFVVMAYRVKKAIRKVRNLRIDSTEAISDPSLVEEGYPGPLVIATKSHRRACLGLDKEKFNIKEQDLRRLREKYSILDDIRLIVLGPDELVLSPPSGYITFYEDAFDVVQFLLHPFIRNILEHYKITPIPFFSNSFRVIISFILICHLVGVEPRCSLFQAIFMLKIHLYDN